MFLAMIFQLIYFFPILNSQLIQSVQQRKTIDNLKGRLIMKNYFKGTLSLMFTAVSLSTLLMAQASAATIVINNNGTVSISKPGHADPLSPFKEVFFSAESNANGICKSYGYASLAHGVNCSISSVRLQTHGQNPAQVDENGTVVKYIDLTKYPTAGYIEANCTWPSYDGNYSCAYGVNVIGAVVCSTIEQVGVTSNCRLDKYPPAH